ncbi:hypothetical protein [Streptomyces sp. CNQ-509]|uniref:hypothetical protein n=1 Tax=Streptomyces sp. CNQ-509 TaxID=444103 RepID=UPI0013DDEC14|nr:hypothetical protein [Streptomyces sp. CNQ-509]
MFEVPDGDRALAMFRAGSVATPLGAHDHGMDACEEGQLAFRSLVALGIFNRGDMGAPPAAWHLHPLTTYTITVSPRWNRLVFITGAPDNVMGYFVPGFGSAEFPGMRLISAYEGTYVARHVPTGAEFVSTHRRSGTSKKRLGPEENPLGFRSFKSIREPLVADEEQAIASIPTMARNARRLLAGLVTRLSSKDPRGRWAIGNWYNDPLRRSPSEERHDPFPERRLWGAGYEWDLEWTGYPYPSDVAQSLTDPAIRLPGARVARNRKGYEVILGSSVLRIRTAQ